MEDRFKDKTELERYKYLCRFLYLTLGFYATEYNYDDKNIVYHPLTGEPASGIMFDRGRGAREAKEQCKNVGINKDDFLKGVRHE